MIEKNWKDYIITKNDTFVAELLIFGGLVSRCEFFESGNVALVCVFAAQLARYMAIFDECDRIEQSVDENMKNKRNNGKRDLNLLIFYTNVAKLAEIFVRKTDWNGANFLLR